MKTVNDDLTAYLNQEKNMISCDLFVLQLANGTKYYYTNADTNVVYGGNTYRHDQLLIKRQQVKLNATVVVDTMTITVYADGAVNLGSKGIKIAAHDGTLDRAKMFVYRAFFDSDNAILGVMGIFGGSVEVKKCGGLTLELTVKAQTQGLSQEFPRRKYYPQGAYSTTNGKVTSSNVNTDSCLIAPFVPLKEVLL